MKLFSRKALVAGAAAVALSFAGTSVAAADEQPLTPFSSSSSSSDEKKDDTTEKDPNKPEENGSSDLDAKDITAWISVFTAVIGALGAAFSFATKYLGFKL